MKSTMNFNNRKKNYPDFVVLKVYALIQNNLVNFTRWLSLEFYNLMILFYS